MPLLTAQMVADSDATAPLEPGGCLALGVVAGVFVALQIRRISIELLFLTGLVIVTLAGVITPRTAFSGFSNSAVLMIGALFSAAAGLRTTGALDWVGQFLLGGAKDERSALCRLTILAPVSAVVLNTPLVAMMAPVVIDWCRKRSVSPSRILIPLSYLTILGGVGTVIGTSTTLVCNAKLTAEANSGRYEPQIIDDLNEIGFLEIGWVGIPVALMGIAYLLTLGPRLLPSRVEPAKGLRERRREYLVEMSVHESCPLVGKSVEEAGLRNLPGLFLIEIDRGEEILTPVTPKDVLQARDRMVFTGVVETIADLERIPGLAPSADLSYESQPDKRANRHLTEAVLSPTSPIIGRTVCEANFRGRYNAAIVAVHRNGERLTNKIGAIRLESGDTLLLQTRGEFSEQHRNNRDFYLVSQIEGSSARRHDRALIAGGLFLALIGWLIAIAVGGHVPSNQASGIGYFLANQSGAVAAVAIVLAMIATRCLSSAQARSAVDLQVLITIAAAIGLGAALSESRAAEWLAARLVGGVQASGLPAGWTPYALLLTVYIISMLLTEAITNVAVASLMIPLSISVAVAAGLSPRPFIMAIALSASLSFATPIGYQTNLMVMGPGGYHPRDFLKVGLPLALLTALTSVSLIPLVWGFD